MSINAIAIARMSVDAHEAAMYASQGDGRNRGRMTAGLYDHLDPSPMYTQEASKTNVI